MSQARALGRQASCRQSRVQTFLYPPCRSYVPDNCGFFADRSLVGRDGDHDGSRWNGTGTITRRPPRRSLPRQRHPMSEVGTQRQPRHPRLPRERIQLLRTKRPSDRERSVVAKDRVERPGKQPAPSIVSPPPHQIVHHNTAGRQPVERAQRVDNFIVGQMVEEKRACHVVEGTVPVRRVVYVGTHISQLVLRRATSASTVERSRADVERGDPQVEAPSSTPPDERPGEVAAATCHIEHGDPISHPPPSTELSEPPQRGPRTSQPAADRPKKTVDLVEHLLRRSMVVHVLPLERSVRHPHDGQSSAVRPTATCMSGGISAERSRRTQAARRSVRERRSRSRPRRFAVRPIANRRRA